MNWTHPRILNVKANGLRLGSILKICMLSERFFVVIIFILALQFKIFKQKFWCQQGLLNCHWFTRQVAMIRKKITISISLISD